MGTCMSPEAGTGAARLIEELGGPGFGEKLVDLLGATAGAVYCGAYRFGRGELEVLGAAGRDGTDVARGNAARYERERFWERDWVIDAADTRTRRDSRCVALRVDPSQISDPEFREYFFQRPGIEDKVLLAGRRGADAYGVAVFRTGAAGRFSRADLVRLESLAEFLVSCCARHCEATRARREASAVFASVPALEERLRAGRWRLSAREVQVCARMLAGWRVDEIARELGVAAESVATYRKRAFQRMGIASRHELLRELLRGL